MKKISFDLSKIYHCNNGTISQTVVFYGMSGDSYVFIPYNPIKQHYCGTPCTLSEQEAIKMITPFT